LREVILFFDEAATAAIEHAVAFAIERGLTLTQHTQYSAIVNGGQVAAVPIQLRPAWCRVWVTVEEGSEADLVLADFVALHRGHSRDVEAQVRALEADVYSEVSWPAYEAKLRTSLERAGTDPKLMAAKIAAFKQRWQALGRKAASAPPEEHLSA
jgi:hypothetical protein